MTSSRDRRHRLRMHPIPVVNRAIDSIVYDAKDREILRKMFVDGSLTYEAAAEIYGWSTSGIKKHIGKEADRVETFIKHGKLN